jgi:hypothetical protein
VFQNCAARVNNYRVNTIHRFSVAVRRSQPLQGLIPTA